MQYDERSLKKISEKYQEINRIYPQLMIRIQNLGLNITNDKAKEYLTHGAGRRLQTIMRCIHNIFSIFPVGQTELLAKDELSDLSINLHAFFVNISGLLDNLGWVFVFENNLLGKRKDGKLGRNDVGLFNKSSQKHFPDLLQKYLQSDYLNSWYLNYSKNYRDSLAHRIPLYVPPSLLGDEDRDQYLELEEQLHSLDLTNDQDITTYRDILDQQKKLDQVSPFFAHSLSEEGRPVLIHAQVVTDYITIEEIIQNFCEHLEG